MLFLVISSFLKDCGNLLISFFLGSLCGIEIGGRITDLDQRDHAHGEMRRAFHAVKPGLGDGQHIFLIDLAFEDPTRKFHKIQKRGYDLNFGMNTDVRWDTANNPELKSPDFTFKKALITSAHAIAKRLL